MITVLGYRIECEAKGCDDHVDVAVSERAEAVKVARIDGWYAGPSILCPAHAYVGEEAHNAKRGPACDIHALDLMKAQIAKGIYPPDFPPDPPPKAKRGSRRRLTK